MAPIERISAIPLAQSISVLAHRDLFRIACRSHLAGRLLAPSAGALGVRGEGTRERAFLERLRDIERDRGVGCFGDVPIDEAAQVARLAELLGNRDVHGRKAGARVRALRPRTVRAARDEDRGGDERDGEARKR